MSRGTASSRVVAVDITRALAIIGMIAVHSLYAIADDGGPTLSYSIAAGKSSAAFAVLAGVSISFIVGRRRLGGTAAPGKVASLLTRAGLIGIIGLVMGYTDGSLAVVILPYYALMFALAIPMAALSTRALAITTAVLFIFTPIVSQLVRPYVVDGLLQQLDFVYLFTSPVEFFSDILLTGQFPALVWMSYIGVGLLIGRCRLKEPKTMAYLVGIGAGLVVVSKFASFAIVQLADVTSRLMANGPAEQVHTILAFGSDGAVPTTTWWWLTINEPHSGTTFDLMTTTGYTMLVLGAISVLEYLVRGRAKQVFDVIAFPLASAGTMALTAYVGHLIWINSPMDVAAAVPTFWGQVLVILAGASLWSMAFPRGPLEAVVTAGTKYAERRVNQQRESREKVSV